MAPLEIRFIEKKISWDRINQDQQSSLLDNGSRSRASGTISGQQY